MRIAVILVTVFTTAACGRSSSTTPTAPSTPVPPAPPQYVVSHIAGSVYDTAYRELAGARVEIVEGQVGAVAFTDDRGRFALSGTFAGTVVLRATRDGFAAADQRLTIRCQSAPCSETASAYFTLKPDAPTARLEAGQYTMTVSFDSACADIPLALRTRTYTATITPNQDDSSYLVSVTGDYLHALPFALRVAGDYVAFEDDLGFWEDLPNLTFLEWDGAGHTNVDTSAPVSSLSIALSASVNYCVLNSALSPSNNCFATPAAQVVARTECVSGNNQIVLRRQ